MDVNFTQADGLMMVGLPNKTIPLVKALSEKTGYDMATTIANALIFMARKVLSDAEQRQLMAEIERIK